MTIREMKEGSDLDQDEWRGLSEKRIFKMRSEGRAGVNQAQHSWPTK